jgi:hypothetical protein
MQREIGGRVVYSGINLPGREAYHTTLCHVEHHNESRNY